MDIKTTFLYGIIDQLFYVEIPKRYEQQWKNQICRFKKVLYGLKLSSRLWYEQLTEFLFTKSRFYCLYANHSIFITNQGINGLIITIFMDNLNIFPFYRSEIICYIKKKLIAIFEIVDIKLLVFYIRLKITWDREKRIIKLLQSDYIEKLLNCHNLCKIKTTKVLM